jgi:hypothetical protein
MAKVKRQVKARQQPIDPRSASFAAYRLDRFITYLATLRKNDARTVYTRVFAPDLLDPARNLDIGDCILRLRLRTSARPAATGRSGIILAR